MSPAAKHELSGATRLTQDAWRENPRLAGILPQTLSRAFYDLTAWAPWIACECAAKCSSRRSCPKYIPASTMTNVTTAHDPPL
ncbi:MAG: hypothetical protein BroJett003_16720 [Planctomycetota bacterium]|nr:MAG: hypothetical protein BroJett003_16720 [Planctomycetota bacterium]